MKSFTALISLAALVAPSAAAANFAVLAVNNIINTGASVIGGNVGVVDGTIQGMEEATVAGVQTAGIIPASARDTSNAAVAAIFARKNGGQPPPPNSSIVLADTALDVDTTLTAATYAWEQDASINGVLTLSGPGVFTFNIPSSLSETAGSSVVLADGATAENVFWNTGREIVLGADAEIAGQLHTTSGGIILGPGATVDGTVDSGLDVIMDSATVTG